MFSSLSCCQPVTWAFVSKTSYVCYRPVDLQSSEIFESFMRFLYVGDISLHCTVLHCGSWNNDSSLCKPVVFGLHLWSTLWVYQTPKVLYTTYQHSPKDLTLLQWRYDDVSREFLGWASSTSLSQGISAFHFILSITKPNHLSWTPCLGRQVWKTSGENWWSPTDLCQKSDNSDGTFRSWCDLTQTPWSFCGQHFHLVLQIWNKSCCGLFLNLNLFTSTSGDQWGTNWWFDLMLTF